MLAMLLGQRNSGRPVRQVSADDVDFIRKALQNTLRANARQMTTVEKRHVLPVIDQTLQWMLRTAQC